MRPLLEAISLQAGYGSKTVLHKVSIAVSRGEIVALLGHNGSGKSTLLKSIMGLLQPSGGRILLEGHNITEESPARHVQAGISYVGQGNRIFSTLSVDENLEMGCYLINGRSQIQARKSLVYSLFPMLVGRRKQLAATLSGGERQALAFAMGLMVDPKIFLLDEPSIGLSSALVRIALARIKEISASTGAAVLIVEQKIREVLRIADRAYLLTLGEVAFHGTPDQVEYQLSSLYLT